MAATPEDVDTLYAYLTADQWRAMLSFYRGWLAVHCPRDTRADVEVECGWVGTLFAIREQLAKRAKLPETDQFYVSPADATAEMRREIASHLDNVLAAYRRRMDRWDNPESAEKRIAQTLKNLGLKHLTEVV